MLSLRALLNPNHPLFVLINKYFYILCIHCLQHLFKHSESCSKWPRNKAGSFTQGNKVAFESHHAYSGVSCWDHGCCSSWAALGEHIYHLTLQPSLAVVRTLLSISESVSKLCYENTWMHSASLH